MLSRQSCRYLIPLNLFLCALCVSAVNSALVRTLRGEFPLVSDRFEHHARTVTLLTFVSRVTGLARDAALSRVFGVSALTDAFWFAFMIPNLFRRLFGEGALSAAFLPVYA